MLCASNLKFALTVKATTCELQRIKEITTTQIQVFFFYCPTLQNTSQIVADGTIFTETINIYTETVAKWWIYSTCRRSSRDYSLAKTENMSRKLAQKEVSIRFIWRGEQIWSTENNRTQCLDNQAPFTNGFTSYDKS